VNSTSAVVLTGVVVGLGRWANDKPISIKVVVSVTFLAIILAALSEADNEFGSKMGLLVLVAAVFTYGPAIVKKAGLIK
jgi:hypothetical protein